MSKPLTLAIIIPAYNEEHHLEACLAAIAKQTVAPDEVIVVNNNSTDRTVEIAKSFPFVRIVHEKKQGFTPARNAGFKAAKADILGRIDADAIVANDWVERVRLAFKDDAVWGVTGLGAADIFPRSKHGKTVLWSWLYFKWSEAFYGSRLLWGANMALRKNAWKIIEPEICPKDSIVHEDQDLSILLLAHGGKIVRDNQLRITTGGQTYHYFPKLMHYTTRRWTTKHYHRSKGNLAKIRPEFAWWRRALTYFCLLPGILFYVVSFLLWPVDWTLKQLGRASTWLD